MHSCSRYARAWAGGWLVALAMTFAVIPGGPAGGAPAPGTVSLQVNTTTGDMRLLFNQATTFGYEIDSASKSMNGDAGHYYNLTDRGTPNWISLSRVPKDLFEGVYPGQPLYGPYTGTVDLAGPSGNPFVVGGTQDLVFRYLDDHYAVVSGAPTAGAADAPAAGPVAAGTTQLWNPGVVEYVSGVPEPTSLALIGFAMGVALRRRRGGRPA